MIWLTIMTNNKLLKNEKGFTLLELVVAASILGIVALFIVHLVNGQAQTFARVFNDSELLNNGKRAMDLLRRDLHGVAPASINTMTSSNLVFTKTSGESIEYTTASKTISRNGTVIAEYITNNPFSYLDANQSSTGSTAGLVFVKVNLVLGKLEESLQLEEIIYLRN